MKTIVVKVVSVGDWEFFKKAMFIAAVAAAFGVLVFAIELAR